MTGKVNYRNFIAAMGSRLLSFLSLHKIPGAAGGEDPFKTDLRSLIDHGVPVLFIHAEGDEGLDYVQMVLGDEAKRWNDSNEFRFEIIQGANHTFALLWSQEKLLQLICDWAEQTYRKASAGAGHL